MAVTTYTNRLKKRMPYEGQENWKDERDTDDQIDDVVMGALLTGNRVISGGAVSDGGGLNADYATMIVRVAGTIYNIASGSIALTAAGVGLEQANWIYVDNTGTVVAAITPPSGDYIPLALVDTSDTAIVRVADLRPVAPDVEGIVENDCINGTFEIWQQGTTQTTSGYESDDKWRNYHNGSTKTHSQQSFSPGQNDVPGNPAYYSRTSITSVVGAANRVQKEHRILNLLKYSGKTVQFTFYAKADSAKNIAVEMYTYDGSTFNLSEQVETVSLTTSFAKYHLTFNVRDLTGETLTGLHFLGFSFWLDAGSDYDARTNSLGQQGNWIFDLAEVEIYISDKELPVQRRTAQEELDRCLAYLQAIAATIYPLPGGTAIRHRLQTRKDMVGPFSVKDIYYVDTAGTDRSGAVSISYSTVNGFPIIYFSEDSVNNMARNFTGFLSADL